MWSWIILGIVALLVLVTVHDLVQRRHAILRNFPIIGHSADANEEPAPGLVSPAA